MLTDSNTAPSCPQYLRTHLRIKLGCSKCRYSKGGCGKCRADAAAAGAGASPAAAAATKSPAAGRQSAGRRQQQQGAAQAPASKTPVAAVAAAGQQLQRRRERRQQEEDDEVPSQDLAGSKAAPLVSPAVTARRKSGVGASGEIADWAVVQCVELWSELISSAEKLLLLPPLLFNKSNKTKHAIPPLTARCFDGCVFLVTGFGDAPDAKRAVVRALREGGATVADAVPDPLAAQARLLGCASCLGSHGCGCRRGGFAFACGRLSACRGTS